MANNVLLLIARVLLAAIFVVSGIFKFVDLGGTAGYISSVGLPAAGVLAFLAAAFETVGGLAILVGFQTRIVSYLLAAFCVFTAFVFHGAPDQINQIMLMKNLAIAGGFLSLAIGGAGALSLDGRRAA